MRKFETTIEGHRITMEYSLYTGKERISYDGRVVSEKRSLQMITPHSFRVQEAGQEIVYEVNLLTGFLTYGFIVRRNGIIVAHKP